MNTLQRLIDRFGSAEARPQVSMHRVTPASALWCAACLVVSFFATAHAQEPPAVRAVDIEYAAKVTIKNLNISQLAGMSDDRIQQEYEWCRGMADHSYSC